MRLAIIAVASAMLGISAFACSGTSGTDVWTNTGGTAGKSGAAGSAGLTDAGGQAGQPDGAAGLGGTAGAAAGGAGGTAGSAAGGAGGTAAGGTGGDASVDQSVDAIEEPVPDVPLETCFQYTCSADDRQVLDCWNNVVETCAETEICKKGFCKSACLVVEDDQSSVGCHYVPVDLDEHHGGSCFVAMVANTWPYNAHITVRRWNGTTMADLPVETFTRMPSGSGQSITYNPYSAATGIEPGKVALVFLAGAASGGVACPSGITPASPGSAVKKGTGLGEGFEIETDVPIVAYQMNPYGGGSAAVTGASLLLPNASGGKSYIAMNAYSSATGIGANASLNVVAYDDDTDVTFTPVAAVTGGSGVPASAANTPFTVNLRRAQYMQITQAAELTGSVVSATKKVGFFAGNTCAQVPVGASYCDHQEQMIPPVRAFGSEYAAVQYKPRGTTDPTRWRFVSAADGTSITFDPASVHAPITLNKGAWTEITSQTPFLAKSQDNQHPFFVAAFMTGSSQVGGAFAGDSGDPDMCNIIPPEQYMKKYVFLSDSTYPTTNLVFVRKRLSNNTYADVNLDCVGVLQGWQNLDSQGLYQYTRQDLVNGNFAPVGSCNNGVHQADSTEPFGLWVWGWGYNGTSVFTANVSYSYPAGANVTTLNNVMP
ncbi:MAG: IgGFc-binding protein [Deltaproteobacteria bacterium]|nr:IgGFc-binding protein [Deltaproteobacteria bacterium]